MDDAALGGLHRLEGDDVAGLAHLGGDALRHLDERVLAAPLVALDIDGEDVIGLAVVVARDHVEQVLERAQRLAAAADQQSQLVRGVLRVAEDLEDLGGASHTVAGGFRCARLDLRVHEAEQGEQLAERAFPRSRSRRRRWRWERSAGRRVRPGRAAARPRRGCARDRGRAGRRPGRRARARGPRRDRARDRAHRDPRAVRHRGPRGAGRRRVRRRGPHGAGRRRVRVRGPRGAGRRRVRVRGPHGAGHRRVRGRGPHGAGRPRVRRRGPRGARSRRAGRRARRAARRAGPRGPHAVRGRASPGRPSS